MKPVIITINSDGKVVMSVDEFKRHMDSAYNQGYSDGNSTHSITYLNANKPWWEDLTINGGLTTTLCSDTNTTTTTTTAIDDTQLSISDYLRAKGE